MSGILNCATDGGFRVTYEDRVKTATSSKGNQIKWRRPDGVWLKADDMGYEGISEQTAGRILENSNIDDYTDYITCRIYEDDDVYTGCASVDFLRAGETLITLARLFQADVLRYHECQRHKA